MKIILISGLSGSGKSVALRLLEDVGYYCVDNLPVEMLPELVKHHIDKGSVSELGVSVDVRSRIDIKQAQEQMEYLRREGHQVDLLFLEADESVLVRRFSETRRCHPLSGQDMTLLEGIQKERSWLFPLRDMAYCIDTSKMNAQQLRYSVQKWLQIERQGLLVILESFGFKYGTPSNADFLFDVRSLPNPYYDLELRHFNGMEKPIQDYLDAQPLAQEMLEDIEQFINRWLPRMQVESRSYVTIGIGCTGGRHRSVYLVERLAQRLQGRYELLVRHRQADNLSGR
ncbi:RNase adapter RapZ [Neisseria weaveri]|uniref:ATP-binding protein n=1 Tax=Neisseria weaveri TaxID=28091 RepID=A0A448VPJ8_9NEIS|nr:RNase adapter RapZ [Neisseria weaveri]SAY50287.1 ATP-binding protein [Neisseria weaveri]VEJ51691.1 ATP-binding protein [Neisseria weaveri]